MSPWRAYIFLRRFNISSTSNEAMHLYYTETTGHPQLYLNVIAGASYLNRMWRTLFKLRRQSVTNSSNVIREVKPHVDPEITSSIYRVK